MSAPNSPELPNVGLRERHVQALPKESSPGEEFPAYVDHDVEKEPKTFGRTPDGTSALFPFPQTIQI